MERLRRAWPRLGLGIELYGDLGGNFGLNSPRLDNFGQTLERKPGLFGGGGVILRLPAHFTLDDTPTSRNVHVRLGGQVIHSESETTRVVNDAGGFLRTTGHHNTNAVLATIGLGVQPFDSAHPLGPIRFTFDAGLGRAFHNVSVFGPAGNQVIRSNDSSFAWMARGAAIYQVTENIGIGVFVSHFRADGITAFLANGNPFALGGRNETAAGLTMTVALAPPSGSFFPVGVTTVTTTSR